MTDELSDLRRRLAQAEAMALTLQQQRDQAEADAAALKECIVAAYRAFRSASALGIQGNDQAAFADLEGGIDLLAAATRRYPAGASLLAVAEAARAYVLANPEFENLADLLVALRDAVRRWDR